MNVNSLAGRRMVRAGVLLGSAVGWVVVAIGAAVDSSAAIAVGAVLAGSSNVVAAKLAFESRTVVDAAVASNRSLASEIVRTQRSLASLDPVDGRRGDVEAAVRSMADVERHRGESMSRIEGAQERAAAGAARLEKGVEEIRRRLSRLEEAHGTTVDALSLTRSVVDKLASRVSSTVSPERMASLARQTVESPVLSIAIPSFNRPDFLAECLASVEEEIRGSFEDSVEVCIMDDASPDPDTLDVAAAFAERCCFASVFRQQANVGLERNIIAACQPCRGEYILLMGNDDVMVPGAMATMLTDLRTVAAPIHLYEKTRITVEGAPRDAVPGSSPIDLPPGDSHRFDTLIEAAGFQGFFSTFGFISSVVFRRTPFVAVDPTPYLDLTMYSHVFALVEAFAEEPVFYRNQPTVLHRTAPQSHKLVEALGRKEAAFMVGGSARRARYFGTALAAAWQRLIDRKGFDPAWLEEQPENLMSTLPLLSWIAQNRALDGKMDGTLDPLVVADGDRFMASFHREPIV